MPSCLECGRAVPSGDTGDSGWTPVRRTPSTPSSSSPHPPTTPEDAIGERRACARRPAAAPAIPSGGEHAAGLGGSPAGIGTPAHEFTAALPAHLGAPVADVGARCARLREVRRAAGKARDARVSRLGAIDAHLYSRRHLLHARVIALRATLPAEPHTLLAEAKALLNLLTVTALRLLPLRRHDQVTPGLSPRVAAGQVRGGWALSPARTCRERPVPRPGVPPLTTMRRHTARKSQEARQREAARPDHGLATR